MSKQDRAAKAIDFAAKRGYGPEQIATLLNELELLAPAPPEPSRGMTPRGAVWYLNTPIGDIRSMDEDIVAFGHDHKHQSFRLVLTKAEAKTLSLSLLAAANYQEET